MIALEVADLIVIASRTLDLDTDQALGLLDLAAAEQALAQARPSGVSGPSRPAAALLHALVGHRPLRRGNQQVALAAMLQFLALNGWDLDPDPPTPLAAMIAEVAAGRLDAKDLARVLSPRLRVAEHAKRRVTAAPSPDFTVTAEQITSAIRRQPLGMNGRFTDPARRAVHLAGEEARLLRSDSIGTEHLLLGLLYEEEGIAARALQSLGISREIVQVLIGRGQETHTGPVAFTPGTKKALELSLLEAMRLGHHRIDTEHLLLGLIREGEGIAAQVLARLGGGNTRIRERVMELVAECGQAAEETKRAHLAIPAKLADTAGQLARVRRQKEAAFDAGDLGTAATLREREKQLLADEQRLANPMAASAEVRAAIAENQRLHRELDRLRDLLRQHGIEPEGGTAQTA